MAKITGVEAITVSSQLLPAQSPDLSSAHHLTVVADYRDTYRTTVFMDVLCDLVREALDELWPAAPTLTGWQHLTTSLYGRGSSAWASAVQGKAERLEIRNVQLGCEPGAAAFRLLGTADFLEGWKMLFSGAVLSVNIRTVSYNLALVPWEAAYQKAIAPYSKLLAYRHQQELTHPTLEPQALGASL